MANSMQFQLQGLSELSSSLDRINKNLQAEAQFNALGAGAFVLKKAAQSFVPVRASKTVKFKGRIRKKGKLKKSINYKIFKTYSTLGFSEKGAYGFLTTKDPVAHLIEYGHKTRLGTGKSKPRGKVSFVEPRPYMRKAIDLHGAEAVDAIAKVLEGYFSK